MNTNIASTSGSGKGPRNTKSTFLNGKTEIVKPTGQHLATVVWLHSLAQNASLDSLPACKTIGFHHPNVKFICPTAPIRPIDRFDKLPFTAWFNVGVNLEDGPVDMAEVEESAAFIANLLASDPPNVKVVIGGFSMGACIALYSAIYFCIGRFPSGSAYPRINLKGIVSISGHIHGSRHVRGMIDGSPGARGRAMSLPIWMCHGTKDTIVEYGWAEENKNDMVSAGFEQLVLRPVEFGHYMMGWLHTVAPEIRNFLASALELDVNQLEISIQ